MPTESTPHAALPHEIRGYRVQALLGAGAMGAVYRAVASGGRRGLEGGDEVALKVLDPRFAPDAAIVRRFKREAGVGLGGGHPGIARVFEIGSLRHAGPGGERRVHYIVQELLKGGSLQSRLEQEGAQPEPVLREVGRQVAETLAFVHGRNIVHRDLKPANLFLDERGQVKVVDFGLARLVTEEEALAADSGAAAPDLAAPLPSSGLTTAGKFLGTVAYAAPEQLAGAPATPQSDLFALGLVLYEMAAGSHPFARERELGFEGYVAAVRGRDPAPLIEVRPELSWFFARIVQLLLERDPALRLSSAAAVAEAFALGERSSWWAAASSPASDSVSAARRRLGVRRLTRLVGRGSELALLVDESRAAFAGRGRLVVVEGPEGIGTTRLVDALLERLERSEPRADVLITRGEEAAAALEPVRERLSSDEPFAPLLIVVDAAESADARALASLEELSSALPSRPLLLILVLQNDAPLDPEAASRIERLRRGTARVELSRLDVESFQTIARDLAVDARLADRAGRRLHELSGAIPGDAIELAAFLIERKQQKALTDRKVALAELPPALVARYSRRLAGLTAGASALLEAAAVLGADLRLQTLRDILGLGAEEFERTLRQVEVERPLVVKRGGELHFCQPLLRRQLVASAPRERRRAVHLLAARHYERELALPTPAPRTALKAAIHAELARERTVLAATLRRAVRVLELEGALERAWRLVTGAETLARRQPQDVRLLAQALVLRGQLAHRLGRREDERAIWSEAARLSAQLDDPAVRAHAFHGLGRLASRTGRFLAAETYLRDAEQAAQKAARGSGVERSLILLDMAETLLWSGDEERCEQALERAEVAIDAGAAIGSIGRYFKERGNLLLELERFDEAADAYSRGRAVVRGPALRPLHRAMVLGTARLLRETCDFEKARRACELARRSAESDLDLRHLAQAWYVLGDVESRLGEPDRAFLPYLRARRLARQVEDDYLEVSALGSLSFLYRWKRFERHSLPKAIRCARRAIAMAHRLAVGRLEARGLAALALCYRDMKKMPWALAIARKAIREASAAGVRRRRAAEIYWVHGLILGETGETEAARASLDEARRRIERRLLGVASSAVRSRMMERDPLLREIEATRF